MQRYDTHTHSHLSVDSTASVDAMCAGAVANGLAGITITDHLDMNPLDDGYGFYRPDRCFEEVTAARQKYAGRLKVLLGIEFGEPHLYPDTLDTIHARPYDVIIGSIHWVDDEFPGSDVAFTGPASYFARYYAVMLAMIRAGGFDVLGHFDFPKRYLKTNVSDLPIIDEVLEALATSGIALEINTSSLRKGLQDTIPGIDILQRYARYGGTRITFGSDAHTPEDTGAGFDVAQHLVATLPQLQVGYFERRAFIPVAGT